MHRKVCLQQAGARYDPAMTAQSRLLFGLLLLAGTPAATPALAQNGAPLDRALRQLPAPPQDIGTALRANNWPAAEAAAARLQDPLAQKLVVFSRLLAQGAASTAEIAAFAVENPIWPLPSLLERRRQEALGNETDPAILASECRRARLTQSPALLRCAQALGGAPDGADLVRQAWIGADLADPAAEADFLRRFAPVLTQEDHWARFEAIIGNPAVATRQIPRLAPDRRALAEARLAVRRGDAAAPALLGALPADAQLDPFLFLDRAIAAREAGQDTTALALWQARGEPAQARVSLEQREKFWTERHRFARLLLRAGNAEGAYALAALPGELASERKLDAEFLSGFIALRRLNDPARAARHFRTLAATSPAALTQSRAWYWLGRAGEAGAFEKAAAWSMTFYGQLAARALGEDDAKLTVRIRAARDPAFSPAQFAEVAGREGVRAAKLLRGWGETRRAGAFFARMDELAADAGERAALARLALGMGLPDAAVLTARRMGRDGLVLGETGWPMPVDPPANALAAPVSLAIMRQESNFDATIVSPAGARGLMQLMPGTAQLVAKRLGETTSPAALTADPAQNMRLGTTYLADMLAQFSALPLAVAAYNAGPHRVKSWLVGNGDPRPGASMPTEMIDWIELIPFNETRNYVQRVLENIAIYRVRRDENQAGLLGEWGGNP